MNTYRLKISLVEPHYPINELHRIVEVSGNIRFDELHQEIFRLFERHDEHLWQFFISRGKMDSFNKLFNECSEMVSTPDVIELEEEKEQSLHELNELLKENKQPPIQQIKRIKHTADICLDDVGLGEKDYFYYHFDFGDDWLHRIRIEKITQSNDADSYRFTVIKAVGEMPPQYADGSDEFADTPFDPNNISPELDFELSLLSAMMLIVGDPTNPTRFGDLVEAGIADEMLKRELIKPCVSLTHRVQLTAKGESELVRAMEMLGI